MWGVGRGGVGWMGWVVGVLMHYLVKTIVKAA